MKLQAVGEIQAEHLGTLRNYIFELDYGGVILVATNLQGLIVNICEMDPLTLELTGEIFGAEVLPQSQITAN